MFEQLQSVLEGKERRYQGDNFATVKQGYQLANTVFNFYPTFSELCLYKQDFQCRRKGIEYKSSDADRRRSMELKDGVLVPAKKTFSIQRLYKTLKASRKRAVDNLYAYALSNRWRYFCTFTFDKTKVDRTNDDAVKKAWSKFEKDMRRTYPAIKILSVPERHPTSGYLHFHVLIGNVDLSSHMSPQLYSDCDKNRRKERVGQPVITNFGDKVYDMDLYKLGFMSCIDFEDEGKSYNPIRVTNYLSKYMSKDMIVGYNQKCYYRTYNLRYKNKYTTYLNSDDIFKLLCPYDVPDEGQVSFFNLSGYDLEHYKSTSTMDVYRFIPQSGIAPPTD